MIHEKMIIKRKLRQEAGTNATFGRHVSNRIKMTYSESSHQRAFDRYMYGSDPRRGGGLQLFSGPFPRYFKYIIGILSSSPVDWHPFWANWVKGGVCRHVQKSEAHVLGCRPRGESSHWSSNSLKTSRIVPAWESQWSSKKWKQCGAVQASYGCLVGHVCMGVRISVFAP